MITKYKLSDLAKHLKLAPQEIIDCLAAKYGVKKASSSLAPEETNYVLEYFTQHNQVESFDGYFAYRPVRKPKTKPAPKPEVKAEPKSEPKPEPTVSAKAEPKQEVKPEPKPEVKEEPKPELNPSLKLKPNRSQQCPLRQNQSLR